MSMEVVRRFLSAELPGFESAAPGLAHRFAEQLNWLVLPPAVVEAAGHVGASYLRNLLLGCAVYYITAGLWSLAIFVVFRRWCFPDASKMPSYAVMLKQVGVAQKGLFVYVMLPTGIEFLVEGGYTLATEDFTAVPLSTQLSRTAVFMFLCEFGVYAAHRLLHVQPFYRWLHADHHKYNKGHTLSPWASIAFNPFDGILQASPYLYLLFVVPIDFRVHMALLFVTAVWATSIHDTLELEWAPVMGGGYHKIHHTTYKSNFGQYLPMCDWLFGTLDVPKRGRGGKED